MDEQVGLDCQVLQDREAPGKVRTTQSKQPHEVMPCYLHVRAFLVLIDQTGEPRTNFEYILPFIDDAGGCVCLGKCEIGTVY